MVQLIDGENIQIEGNLIPNPTQVRSLGSTGSRWQSIYVGNSTVNVGQASISADDSGIAYSQNGFASPFFNVGPIISVTGAVGGWNVASSGNPADITFDLVAQQNYPVGTPGFTGGGPTGPIYSLIRRVGPTGPQGSQGSTGFAGPQGNQGNQGFTGSNGSTGPQGFQGFTGSTGLQGNQGSTGPQGPQTILNYRIPLQQQTCNNNSSAIFPTPTSINSGNYSITWTINGATGNSGLHHNGSSPQMLQAHIDMITSTNVLVEGQAGVSGIFSAVHISPSTSYRTTLTYTDNYTFLADGNWFPRLTQTNQIAWSGTFYINGVATRTN
jgi:hypothetical protein